MVLETSEKCPVSAVTCVFKVNLIRYLCPHSGSTVILLAPASPVKEGEDVILFCETKDASPRLASQFFKNTHLIRTVSEGHMTISNFSKSNRGNYTCRTGHGESPPLWLLMQGKDHTCTSKVLTDSNFTLLGVSGRPAGMFTEAGTNNKHQRFLLKPGKNKQLNSEKSKKKKSIKK